MHASTAIPAHASGGRLHERDLGREHRVRQRHSNAHHAVLRSHLSFQAEKSTGGGHWKNIKNARYKYIGIGVWKGSGRVRLVTDFYSW